MCGNLCSSKSLYLSNSWELFEGLWPYITRIIPEYDVSRALVKSQYCGVGLWYIMAPGVSSTCHVSWLQHYCRGGGWGWLMRPNCGVQQWSSPLNTAARVNSNWLQFITPHLVPHRFVPGPGPVVCITKQKGQIQEKKVAIANFCQTQNRLQSSW